MGNECQVCSSSDLLHVLDMGHHPPSDRFLSEEELRDKEVHYPLRVVICDDCKLVQLDSVVNPEILFTDKFIYKTGHNQTLREHFNSLVNELLQQFDLGEESFLVDIGSNDGTLLSYFPKAVEVLGVDPSKAADVAIDNGIPTRREFFSLDLAKEISEERGHAQVITCTNTFAHMANVDSFMDGIKELLAEDGVFVQESHYLLDLVNGMQYDEIYHEHLRYYSLTSLVNLFEQYDMTVTEAERVMTHGGSIKTYAALGDNNDIDESVNRLLRREKSSRIHEHGRLLDFADSVNTHRFSLVNLLTNLRDDGHRIVGVGAAAKGVSLLNYCRIGPELVEYIAETNEFKIGKYTPGTHIPIVNETRLLEDDPDYALLLAWNLRDVIVPKLRDCGFDGGFILPNQEVDVIE